MPKYVGIDIGQASVKVAVVKVAYRKTTIEGLASAPLGDDVAAALRSALQEALGGGGAGDAVATSIEGVKVIVRSVHVPASVQKQLAEVLPFELESQTPFDIADAVIDYRIQKSSTRERLSILSVLARTEEVRARIELVKAAIGVEPERVGAGAFPLANLLEFTPQIAADGVACILDLGARSSDLLVMVAGEPVFARTLSLGTDGLPATASKLAREIRVSIAAYRAQGGAAPSVVHITGGGAFVSGAESFLSAELELPVERLPLPNLEMTARATAKLEDAPLYAKSLALALGLGVRGGNFDLRRGALAYERGYGWLSDRIPVLAGLGVALAASFFFSSCASYLAATKEQATLAFALESVSQEVLGEQTSSVARVKELLAQQGAPDEDPKPHADAFDVMVRLSEHIPQSMIHDIEELDVQKGHATVHGIAGSTADAKSIEASLKNEACFSDVKVTRTNQVVGGERQKYSLEFDVKCPEDQKGKKKDKPGESSAGSASAASPGGK